MRGARQESADIFLGRRAHNVARFARVLGQKVILAFDEREFSGNRLGC
jgi:hypothetical protein